MKANIVCSDYPSDIKAISLSTEDNLSKVEIARETVLDVDVAVDVASIKVTNTDVDSVEHTSTIKLKREDLLDVIEALRSIAVIIK